MPTFSIITPCYNAAPFIGATLASVQQQSVQDWEMIVVDDGSTDESAAIVAAASLADPRIRLIRQENGGVCKARNTGFAASSPGSRYLQFLDADDCPKTEMLEALAAYLESRRHVSLAFCNFHLIDREGRPFGTLSMPRYVPTRWGVPELRDDEPETPFLSILSYAAVLPSASLLRREVYERTGGWDEAFGQHYEDTDLMLRMALYGEVHYLPRVLYHYRRHPGQSSENVARFASQERKLLAKWRAFPGGTAEQARHVRAALRFRDRRLTPYLAFKAGNRYMHEQMPLRALRFYLGGLRRFRLIRVQ